MITIRPKHKFAVPVDAECITPDSFGDKSIEEIAALQAWEGNKKRTLDDLFKIEGEPSTISEAVSIHVFGDVSRVRRVGAEMSMGKIVIERSAGMHLGESMRGGTITVCGDAGSWAGCMMSGGTLEIKGNVLDYVGAPYRGSTKGMSGGLIVVHGNAGNEVGCYMRNGLIKVYGNIGQFAGVHMKKGTIFVGGNCKGRCGAGMVGGKIIICAHIPSVLPTFTIDAIKPQVKVDGEVVLGPFYCFVGDLADSGKGKLFFSQRKNTQLEFYEKYL
jgi:formylmethanofuran dehydrogenase subunit C